jgi:naphthalene 1,2-dioxygenase ferredoxin reductase component
MPFVTVPQLSCRFFVDNDETIVEAAIRQGVAFPFSCHSGTCGTCKSLLADGTVSLLDHYSKFTLSDQERAGGKILACCAIPQTDCEVRLIETSPIQARRFVCTVTAIRDATHDIKIVELEPNSRTALAFLPGQYADLKIADLPVRSYSMASKPGQNMLEFHIRLSPGGAVTPYVHSALAPGSPVELWAPLGGSYLRPRHIGPVLLAAGGAGLAPIKSILEALIEEPHSQGISLYFGVRDQEDLYYLEYLHALANQHKISFVPVLSAPKSATRFRTGYLADVIASDVADFSGFKAYLAGPQIMVDSCRSVMLAKGLRPDDFHADVF